MTRKITTIPSVNSWAQQDIQRFWACVDIKEESDCWEWKRAKVESGYGVFRCFGKQLRSHRCAYSISVGEIPDRYLVCHRCDNPSCCNPAHLFAGTDSINMLDRSAKGRQRNGYSGATHCKRGHEYDGWIPPSHGTRLCRRCHAESNRRDRLSIGYKKKRAEYVAARRLRLGPVLTEAKCPECGCIRVVQKAYRLQLCKKCSSKHAWEKRRGKNAL